MPVRRPGGRPAGGRAGHGPPCERARKRRRRCRERRRRRRNVEVAGIEPASFAIAPRLLRAQPALGFSAPADTQASRQGPSHCEVSRSAPWPGRTVEPPNDARHRAGGDPGLTVGLLAYQAARASSRWLPTVALELALIFSRTRDLRGRIRSPRPASLDTNWRSRNRSPPCAVVNHPIRSDQRDPTPSNSGAATSIPGGGDVPVAAPGRWPGARRWRRRRWIRRGAAGPAGRAPGDGGDPGGEPPGTAFAVPRG